jgi:hypothetical protein
MVLSFHKYWNYNNQASIQHILDTRDKYNVPVWLGETGENSNVWFTEAIHLLESNNIGWSWWPLKKMGNNNPMQIQSNAGYDKILAYWNGRGPKPGEAEAYQGLMRLAESAKLENTIIKRDVMDALFRQPFSRTAIPFQSNQISDGTVLYAVNYDLGRNGIAYYDTDTADYHVSTGRRGTGNRGNCYRNDGVDIAADSTKTGYYVTAMEKGEWLQYSLNVMNEKSYDLKIIYAGKEPANKILLTVNGKPFESGSLEPGKWSTATIKDVHLKEGKNILHILVEEGELDLKSIQFEAK